MPFWFHSSAMSTYFTLQFAATARCMIYRKKRTCRAYLPRTEWSLPEDKMTLGANRMLLTSYVVVTVLALSAICGAQSAQPLTTIPSPKTTEQVYKNIQVLKGVPADQLIPAMQFITASLGVQCDFCHLENAFDKDDKKTKQTARKMMRMMFAINKDNFDGHKEVTCYACHRGSHKPVITPLISVEDGKFAAEEKMHHAESNGASLPSADQILGKY